MKSLKLLPKAKGSVSRKPLDGSKNKFTSNPSKHSLDSNKILIYNNFIKKLIRENPSLGKEMPGVFKSVITFLKDPKLKRMVDPKERFVILRVSDFITSKSLVIKSMISKSERGGNTKNAFFIQINSNKQYRFYLKETYQNTINEFKTLNFYEKEFKKHGFNIIKPHLAFKNKDKRYILYDFTNRLTVFDAFQLKKISENEYKSIIKQIKRFRISFELDKGISLSETHVGNCFIEFTPKGHKLYLFDIFSLGGNSLKL
jgi:hypothetical protein